VSKSPATVAVIYCAEYGYADRLSQTIARLVTRQAPYRCTNPFLFGRKTGRTRLPSIEHPRTAWLSYPHPPPPFGGDCDPEVHSVLDWRISAGGRFRDTCGFGEGHRKLAAGCGYLRTRALFRDTWWGVPCARRGFFTFLRGFSG
jgi:hypothetical protein